MSARANNPAAAPVVIRSPFRPPMLFAVLAIAAAALALRVLGLDTRWLWFDELLSVNFANHGLFETLVTAARFDVHPPVYYLQLSVWMRFGQSDAWVALDSVLWSMIAIAFIAATARRMASDVAAVVAAAILGALPAAVLYAQQVRMYAFIMAWLSIALWAWQRAVERGRLRDAVGAAMAILVVVYSHGVGAVMAAGVCAYPLARWAAEGRNRRVLRAIALGYAIIVVASVPALGFSGSRGVLHTLTPTWDDVALSLHEILFGRDNALGDAPRSLSAIVALALTVLCLGCRASRIVFACTVLLPIAAVLAISYALTPIWLTRTIVVFVPFVALSLALAVDALRGRMARPAGIATAVIALALASLQQQSAHRNGDDFRPAAAFIRDHAQPGDAVFAALGPFETWALLWYVGGPRWGTPLSFHEINPAWRRMLDRLGPDWVRRLGLLPTRDAIDASGVIVTAPFARAVDSLAAPRIFVVRKLDLAGFSPPGRLLRERSVLRQMAVEIWAQP